MAEKRRLNRVTLVISGKLMWDVASADCQLENLSMDGALIATKSPSLTGLGVGDVCRLQIPQEEENLDLTIQAQVVHLLHPLVGLKFCGVNLKTYSTLEYVIQQEKAKQSLLGVIPNSPPPGFGAVS